MKERATRFVGPLGSTIHHLRADAETVAAVAGVDWNRWFRRVCLDPVREVITLMSPSTIHEDLSEVFAEIVAAAADALGLATKSLRQTRLRGSKEPPRTGMEADCAFFVGERVRAYLAALEESVAAAETFLERNGPDLVAEVEVTHADRGKIERYRDLGVREFWQVRGVRDRKEVDASFFSLSAGAPPKPLEVSVVLPGLLPVDVCEAVHGVRFGLTRRRRTEAVARIVRRRERQSLRVREEPAEYRVGPPAAPVTFPCACSLHDGAAPAPRVLETSRAEKPATCFVGPLGSTIHHLRVDTETVLQLSGVNWERRFRRARLDPAAGVITLVETSRLREEYGGIFRDLVDGAASAFGRPVRGLRHYRFRRRGDPFGAGVEADGAFYVGDRANAYGDACLDGDAAADAFVERTGPDLVVEVEPTRADEGKIEQYASLGAREFWRVRGRRGRREVEPEFLAIGVGFPSRPLAASEVLPGLTPQDARDAVPGLRMSPGLSERMRIVAEIVRRRPAQRDGASEERVETPVEAGAASPVASRRAGSPPAATTSGAPPSECERAAS